MGKVLACELSCTGPFFAFISVGVTVVLFGKFYLLLWESVPIQKWSCFPQFYEHFPKNIEKGLKIFQTIKRRINYKGRESFKNL